jgi:WD40 repeat protein
MSEITGVKISTDSSSFGVILSHSFQIYQVDPLKRKCLKDFVNYKITHIAVHGDGTLIAFSVVPQARDQASEKVFVWNNQYGEAHCQLEFKTRVTSIALTSEYLLVVLVNSTLVYDIAERKIQYEVITAQNNHGAGDVIRPDQCILAICGLEPGTVSISEIMSDSRPVVFQAHQHPLSLIRFSPDGSIVATASEKGTLIRLFDGMTGAQLSCFRRGAMPSRVLSVCFSQTNSDLIAVSENGTVHLFEADTRNASESDPPRAIAKLSIAKAGCVDSCFCSGNEVMIVAGSGHMYRIRCMDKTLDVIGRSFILAH